jgi:lysozyme family protein
MQNNFDKCIALVLKSEGGFTDNPKDPGNHLDDGRQGCTNLGVTQAAWEAFVGHKVSTADMKALTPETVGSFYKAKYWMASYANQLPVGVDYCILDASINMGVGRAVKLLQECLGCVPDGTIGPRTMQLIDGKDPKDVVEAFSQRKISFYESLATFATFGKGWLKRVEDVKQNALKMIGESNGN